MAKQFETKDQFDSAMVALAECLTEHFGLQADELDTVLYEPLTSEYKWAPLDVDSTLQRLCGYPEYHNYN
jgi:hypothetical protein